MLVLLAAMPLWALLPGAVARASSLSDARGELYRQYGEQLAKLAAWCDEQKLADAAECTRHWLPPYNPTTVRLFVLPEVGDWQWPGKLDNAPPAAAAPVAPGDSPGAKVGSGDPSAAAGSPYRDKADDDPLTAWRARFRKLREAQAESLFALARQAITEGQPSLAQELILETAHENPDHKQARRLLGYLYTRDRWVTPFAAQQQAAGKVWHPRFGWLAKNHLARYERGERLYHERWISAAEDERVHSAIERGWQIESAHYLVTTNASLEAGVQLAEQLEQLYGFWQTLFGGYVAGEADLVRRFNSKAAIPRDLHKYKVVCFRDQGEYNATLRPEQPSIDRTLGIYFNSNHQAYFFAGAGQDPGTLHHEATHQLFQETRLTSRDVGKAGNFWIVEGIACYMESLTQQENGRSTVGSAKGGRLPAARQALVRDQFYVPLEKLVTYNVDTLQGEPNIAKLYSQAAGLATFLMNYDGGRYRGALIGYLEAVYTGRATTRTLAEKTGTSYEELDRQYREFVEHK